MRHLAIRRPVGRAIRRPVGGVALVAAAGGLLVGCHVPTGASTDQVVVDFVTSTPGAARATVAGRCGGLPGVSVLRYPNDPSVHFDIRHASTSDVVVLTQCLSGLVADRSLQIRGYRIEDGSNI